MRIWLPGSIHSFKQGWLKAAIGSAWSVIGVAVACQPKREGYTRLEGQQNCKSCAAERKIEINAAFHYALVVENHFEDRR
jgi:hypothetical protein